MQSFSVPQADAMIEARKSGHAHYTLLRTELPRCVLHAEPDAIDDLFRSFDHEGDGTLGKAELRHALKALEDAVDVLDDCMVLVDELVGRLKDHLSSATNAPEGALCRNVVDGLKAGWIVSKPTAPDGEAVQLVGAGQKDALQKAAEAMTDVCVDSVEKAEAGVRSEDDAMKLRNAVAPLCEESARKRLGNAQSDSAAVNGTLREWCYQLDGRLALALETGFLFALHPEDAYKQAGTDRKSVV